MLEAFIGKPLSVDKLERPVMQHVGSRMVARPELQHFDAQSKTLDARRRAVNASVMPRFSAFAQGYYGYPGLDVFKSMLSDGPVPERQRSSS